MITKEPLYAKVRLLITFKTSPVGMLSLALLCVLVPNTFTGLCCHLIKSKEIMQILQSAIGEKKKKARRPEILHHSYVDRIYDEIETLQNVVADI